MPAAQKSSSIDLATTLSTATKPVVIAGKTFSGKNLNLASIEVPVPVTLKNCTFKGKLDLSMSQVKGTLDLSGSKFAKCLSLEGARIGHHLILDGCTFGSKPGKANPTKAQQKPALNTWRTEINGDILLRNKGKFYSHWLGRDMQIKGGLSLEGLTMEGKPRPRAQLTHARVGGGVVIHGVDFGALFLQVSRIGLGFIMSDSTFTDEANFVGTSIGGQAAFSGVGFKDNVAFDQAKIEGSLFMRPGGEKNPCIIEGKASFIGASIGGQANFKGVCFKAGVAFNGAEIRGDLFMEPSGENNPCVIEGEARFHGASIGGQASFDGVCFKGKVAFDGAEIRGDLFLQPGGEDNPCTIEGEASFNGASIGGQANFSGTIFEKNTFFHDAHIGSQANFKGVRFKNEVAFDRAKIEGGLFMQPGGEDNPCVIEGEARFHGASIGGQANFKGVGFKGKVAFDRAKIEGDLFMQPGGEDNPCVIEGEARFHGASIGGQASFDGVCFKGKVAFDGAEIRGDLFLQPGGEDNPCTIEGEASFNGASIGGRANFLCVSFGRYAYFQGTKVAADVNILGTTVPVLIANGSHFSKAMNIDAKSKINNLVLRDARIGTLNINWESISGNIALTGSEYNSVENKEKLLSVLLENNVRERQPYEFLENHCRKIGEVDFANDVHYKHRKKVAPPLGKILEPPYWKNITYLLWDRFIRYSTGYGVYLYRLPLCVLASFALAFGLFMCPLFVEAVGGSVERTPPWTVAMWLSIKALMPFGTSIEYTGNEVWRWQPTLLGAVTINILKILVWIGISVSLMAAGGLFRAHRK